MTERPIAPVDPVTLPSFLAALRESGLGYDLRAMTEEDLDCCARACGAVADPGDPLRDVVADLDGERFRRWAWRAVEAYAELARCGQEEARAALRLSRAAMAETFQAGMPATDAVRLLFEIRPEEGLDDDDGE